MMKKIKHNFNRYANSYEEYGFLQKEVANRLFGRLDTINPKNHKKILELGAGTGFLTESLINKYGEKSILATDFAVNALQINPSKNKALIDSHNINLNNKFDIIVSNLMMQWCNFKVVTEQIKNIANNNALLLFSTFGTDTLKELKQSFIDIDNNNHINDFEDMHNLADELLSLGITGVVAESEIITLTYENAIDALKDLKYIGASNPRAKSLTKNKLKQLINNYEKLRINGKLPLTYEVVYLHGWINKI